MHKGVKCFSGLTVYKYFQRVISCALYAIQYNYPKESSINKLSRVFAKLNETSKLSYIKYFILTLSRKIDSKCHITTMRVKTSVS